LPPNSGQGLINDFAGKARISRPARRFQEHIRVRERGADLSQFIGTFIRPAEFRFTSRWAARVPY